MLLLNRNGIKKNLSLEGNSSGKLKKSGSNSSQLMSEWSIKQGARQRRPRYREIMILDHIQDMKTLQGRGWLIIFLYLSYQFKISSELEILWRSALLYTLESCENCGLEWDKRMFTYLSNEHLVFYGMKGHKFPIVHIVRISQPCNYQQELGFLFNVRTTQEGMRDMRYCLDGIYAINIFWKRQEGQGRSRGTFKWYLLKPSELFPNIPPESRLPSDYRRKQLGLWPVGLKRIKCTSQSTKLKFNGAE